LFLLVIFAIAIGVATFIEQNHDTATAKMMVYNARWMEILLLLLTINLSGAIFKRKLYRKEKLTIFLFHLGFVVMLLGAGVSRYIGYEGSMHIREGESSNEIYSSETYLVFSTPEGEEIESYKIDRKHITTKPFKIDLDLGDSGNLGIRFKEYIFNAEEKVFENQEGGNDMIEMRVAGIHGTLSGMIEEGSMKQIGDLVFSFQKEPVDSAIHIYIDGGRAMMKAPYAIYKTGEEGEPTDSTAGDTLVEMIANQIYSMNSILFMPVNYYKNAKTKLVSGSEERSNPDALIIEAEYKGKTSEITVLGGDGYISAPEAYRFDDLTIKIGYGNKPIVVPFSIYLEDFILERYPGSNSPSSFESDVILTDNRYNIKECHKIYMNNILDYDGYRFFQSSYDRDERGTILSVSHDWWGTVITYLSYLLLLAGFGSTFFNKHSRFNMVRRRIAKSGGTGKTLMIFIFLTAGIGFQGISQNSMTKPVDKAHADDFGHLFVQTFDGRFQPVHTLAIDVIHKLYKKITIEVPEKG
jgi:hypothetical protein